MKAMTVSINNIWLPLAKIKEEAALYRRLILLYIVFTGGCFAGAVLYSSGSENFNHYINKLIEKLIETDYSQNLRIIIPAYLVPQLLTAVCSFSALGLPIIIICPSVCGMAVSVVISYLYCTYGIDGAVFSLILILPGAVIFLLMLLIGGNEGLILSEIVATSVFSSKRQDRGDLRFFLLRFAVIIVVCTIFAFLQSFCLTKFGKTLLF